MKSIHTGDVTTKKQQPKAKKSTVQACCQSRGEEDKDICPEYQRNIEFSFAHSEQYQIFRVILYAEVFQNFRRHFGFQLLTHGDRMRYYLKNTTLKYRWSCFLCLYKLDMLTLVCWLMILTLMCLSVTVKIPLNYLLIYHSTRDPIQYGWRQSSCLVLPKHLWGQLIQSFPCEGSKIKLKCAVFSNFYNQQNIK